MKDLLTKSDLTEDAVVEALAPTVAQLSDVAMFGREISSGIGHLYMVSCGGGLHIGEGLQWWCKAHFGFKSNVRYEALSAADFLSYGTYGKVGAEALVVLVSKSGSTAEALNVGERLKGTGCRVVCFTQSEGSEIVGYGVRSFYTRDTPQSFHAMLMLLYAFIGGIWEEREAWGQLNKLLSSLSGLPNALANASLQSRSRCKEFAERYIPDGTLYFIGSGPMELVSNAFGLCVLEEMFGARVTVYPADHVNHSFVEKKFADGDRIILLHGLDGTRWLTKQVEKWFADKGVAVEVYDAKDYGMGAVDVGLGGMFAPIITEAAFKPMVEELSKVTGEDPDTRKHMGTKGFQEEFWRGNRMVTVGPQFLPVN